MDRSKKQSVPRDRFRINNRIRAREVRLIGEDGSQVGIVSTDEALQRAETANLDLVEVAPNASPPVCRLMDYGKFRYEQSKKEREARRHQKQVELKEVRLRPKTDSHDLEVKANQARRFLNAGDKVKFTVRFRGREMAHTNIGREILEELIEKLRDIATVEQKPLLESRALSLVVAPIVRQSSKKKVRSPDEPKKPSRTEQPTTAAPQPDESPHDDDDIDDDDIDDIDDIDDDDIDTDDDILDDDDDDVTDDMIDADEDE